MRSQRIAKLILVAVLLTLPASAAPKITVSLEVIPFKYIGSCGGTISFNGTITSSGPTSVKYSFVRSDGTVTPPETIIFRGPGSINVKHERNGFDSKIAQWIELRIMQPVLLKSNRVLYRSRCGPLRGDIQAHPEKYDGPCPAPMKFIGRVYTDKARKIKWRFVRSDGSATPLKTAQSSGEKIFTFFDTWTVPKSMTGSNRIEVDGSTQEVAAITVACGPVQ